MGKPSLIITCEHGGNEIPPEYHGLFGEYGNLIESHRGFDAGALELAREFSDKFHVPLFAATVSRLLVDLNRSLHHRALFSPATRGLTSSEKMTLIERYYHPYRDKVQSWIGERIEAGDPVLHLSIHTFTPVLDGIVRHGDIGLLYDPSRVLEKELCLRWQARLKQSLPGFRIRRNYPYRGRSDGFVSFLRARYGEDSYRGLELEINQEYITGAPEKWGLVKKALIESFRCAAGLSD
ncbi:N-formylglutamate amidohydrolase [bacterium]|nr:N-formylglutamate amidohydrolase [bacterium]